MIHVIANLDEDSPVGVRYSLTGQDNRHMIFFRRVDAVNAAAYAFGIDHSDVVVDYDFDATPLTQSSDV